MFRIPSALVLAFLMVASAQAQTPQQFRASVRMHGGSLDEPATGTIYFGGSKMRYEPMSEGESITLIADPSSGTAGMSGPYTTEGQTERFECPGHPEGLDLHDGAGSEPFVLDIPKMTDLPLPSGPQTMTGSSAFRLKVPNRIAVPFPREIDARLQWTLRPMSE